MRSPRQDDQGLRLSVVWEGGPTVAEAISLAEGLPWPAGTRVKLSLRRKPEVNHRHPQLHVIHR